MNCLWFIATGVVEEGPHRLGSGEGDDRIRLKIVSLDRVLVIPAD